MKYTLKDLLEVQKSVDAGITHDGTYNPKFAANAELIEMMDWLGLIKTWAGKPEVDEKQAFMELVDVFAFCMSWFNQRDTRFTPICESLDGDNGIDAIDSLMYCIGNDDSCGTFEHIATICHKVFGRQLQEVFYYYMGKQELTKFRQKNGYKEGTYNKMWLGMEDNEHLTKMLEQGIEIELLPKALAGGYGVAITHA